ncbi:kita-kyushu lung cancer antigen 1 homolog [Papio anubis]|uniref:Cancer/testis antigen 83 n=2 Tax=Cercopithecinae TaxID=9528 RepID=A0A8I5NTI2_PAPAN|nr:kita-kyushu lung cancer antigen 1 homolog [Papio anubis]XP_011832515.1 PREDICTED: kita-kyushu lung cancer antigen 1 homolog [Mandrillus leucophaeus]XP_011943023.1 PREDICTED: kita-kyushu lung cancer antigen 1 homolog [Cercocebus atys]XP_025229217.1 kita-kyushu lung cancer antigen 1 homolog [Theropithecus gelada]
MNIYLLLASSILCALMIVFWKYRFQRNTGEMSSISTAFALLRRSSTGLINSNTDNNLSFNNLSRDILNNFPHSIDMQKRLLVNLKRVEYKMAELEYILVSQGLRGASGHRKST